MQQLIQLFLGIVDDRLVALAIGRFLYLRCIKLVVEVSPSDRLLVGSPGGHGLHVVRRGVGL